MNQHSQSDKNNNDNNKEKIADQVRETVKEKTKPVREKANEVLSETKPMFNEASRQAKSALSEQKDMAVEQLSGLAKALRRSSDELREQDQGAFATYSQQVADQVDHMSDYLQKRDLGDLIYEAENFARRQPELFIGGAFTLGLLAARFLKSSNREQAQPVHSAHSRYPSSTMDTSPSWSEGGRAESGRYSSIGRPERFPNKAP